MNFSQALKMAWLSVFSNKMRSFLTMLGIIIGVLAVTMLVSIGQGATAQITGQIQGLGSNMLTAAVTDSKPVYISLADVENLRNTGGLALVAPLVSTQYVAKSGTRTINTTIEGTTPGYDGIRDLTVQSGRFLAQTDVDNRSSVAVIGTDVADSLFGGRAVVGQTVQVAGRSFQIIGVLTHKGSSVMGSNDNRIIIPVSTAQRMLHQTQIMQIYASSQNSDSVQQGINTLETFLFHKTKSTDNYTIFSQSDLLSTLGTITGTLTAMLGALAGISLLVGGIGIMNIMLVSVTERTREIGIRKAIGAGRGSILVQFLIESMLISLTGGIIGLILGDIGTIIVGKAMSVPMSVSPGVAALALAFAVSVGVIFGLYPANKASKMRPIDALRYE
ncbi:ABC transporter permease [Ethanoligenens sp.]|uniref:ABC transporter permease n=1 Tax=Ethanoligenens sp. TaxID=2099655 RepID=UPI0039EADDEA